MNKKWFWNWQNPFLTVKKTNKSCKPNQSHIIHAAAEMQSLLFQLIVYISSKLECKQISWRDSQLILSSLLSKLSSSIHRLHKSFIVGIQVYFWPIAHPLQKKIISIPMIFKEISLVQYYYEIFSWSKTHPKK